MIWTCRRPNRFRPSINHGEEFAKVILAIPRVSRWRLLGRSDYENVGHAIAIDWSKARRFFGKGVSRKTQPHSGQPASLRASTHLLRLNI
jgi:hypothetical protein